MSLRDQIARDVANVFLNTDDFAQHVTLRDQAGVTSARVLALFSEQPQVHVEIAGGQEEAETASVLLDRSAVLSSAFGRRPSRGDIVEVPAIPSDAYSGEWAVQSVTEDPAAYTLSVRRAKLRAPGGRGAREVRS